MAHKPPELGTFPAILRDYDDPKSVPKELLMNYSDNGLYLKTPEGEVISIAKDIYDKIIDSKIQNSAIHVTDNPDLEVLPPISQRQYNHWYYSVKKSSPI